MRASSKPVSRRPIAAGSVILSCHLWPFSCTFTEEYHAAGAVLRRGAGCGAGDAADAGRCRLNRCAAAAVDGRRAHLPPDGHGLRGHGQHLPGSAALRAAGGRCHSACACCRSCWLRSAWLLATSWRCGCLTGGWRRSPPCWLRWIRPIVFFSRMGIHVTSVMIGVCPGQPAGVAALAATSGRQRWLALAGLLLGLGLWAKVLFPVVDCGPGCGLGRPAATGAAQSSHDGSAGVAAAMLWRWAEACCLARRRCGCTT